MPIFGRLEITDGTTTINLLNNQHSGFFIVDWQPAIPDLKSGGSWADPPTADERELITGQLADVEETFTFDVSAASVDQLIGYLRDLRAMLTKARQYTLTTWQDTPVYLVAQGYQESNVRYTRIKNWRTPEDGNPYGPPMWGNIQGTAIDDYSVVIEHGAWTSNPPGTGTATEISAVETYDGRNLGNVDSTGTRTPTTGDVLYGDRVFIANKRNEANITDIYIDDGGVWGANLMDAAFPFFIAPAVPVVGDATYFGIDTSIADSGPFSNLIFDFITAGFGYTAVWEYWNGAWVGLTTEDYTNTLQTADVKSVSWEQPSDWATRNIAADGGPAITGYWVRCRVTVAAGLRDGGVIGNRDIYSCIWPYIEFQSTATGGDVSALVRILASTLSSDNPKNIFIGLRSMSRDGDVFTPYLNWSDEQNPTGIVVAAFAPGAFAADVESPTGRTLQATYAVTTAIAPIGVINIALAQAQYYANSQYRVYLRVGCVRTNASNTLEIKIRITTIGTTLMDKTILSESGNNVLLDFGILNTPPNTPYSHEINIYVWTGTTIVAGTVDFNIKDIILMPVDEWAAEIGGTWVTLSDGDYFDIDSVSYPKFPLNAVVRDITFAGDPVSDRCLVVSNGQATIQANTKQRYWFLQSSFSGATPSSSIGYLSGIVCKRNQQYYSMRGGS